MRILGVDPGVGGALVILENDIPTLINNYSTEQDFIDVLEEASKEMQIQLQEVQNQLQQAVDGGQMLPDRMAIELEKKMKQN